MIQKRTGGITGLNNGKKRSLNINLWFFDPVIIIIIMSQSTSPQSHRHHVTSQRPCFSNVNCFCFNSAFAPCISILLTPSSPASSISSSKLWLQSRDEQHFILCGQWFTESFFSYKTLTFITKATMSPSFISNDQFPNKLKGQFFCNLISKCNRCIYRYFSFINHPQSVSVWLNCFA